MKKLLSLVLAGMGTIFAVSCSGNKTDTSSNAPTDTAITAAVITVDDLVGKEFSLTNMYEGKEVTIAFPAANMLGGKSAVNSYTTEFALDGEKITLTALASTKMAGPEEDMAVENEYLEILNGANTISLDGDVLTITTASGTNLIYTFIGNVELPAADTNN
ncbi:META domain-containing protein [Brachyspira murdochii]|uniref:DUF306 domain-containing protein n=2 Tax=Brachyspira murdochii TaxID=84378 RepID=D5U4A2_BRAM5|nr:META domain-containing protein [Brachyspira murdochii]ADG72283.1 protein of unknown function DUF306 Meta and HslJ [Brachyspira murdochii DSM 12563]PPS20691.1 heat-shock protein [Brachyspira murdochii]